MLAAQGPGRTLPGQRAIGRLRARSLRRHGLQRQYQCCRTGEAAAKQAWQRTLDFFNKNLR